MGKKKKQKQRGSRTHGKGNKAGRGAGKRGGRGRAGRFKHKRLKYIKQGIPRGPEKGFTRPQHLVEDPETVNVDKLDIHAEEWGQPWGDDGFEVDLDALGVDRLLGKGKVLKPLRIVVGHATEKARAKVEAEGGEIVAPAGEEE